MKVLPAILTDDRETFKKMLRVSESFTDHIQADFMDGIFVPSKSVGVADLEGLRCRRFTEAHIMVQDPLSWLPGLKKFGARRVIFHFEIDKDRQEVIARIKEEGFSVGLAVNPQTEIEEFSGLVDKVEVVLFLSVIPGFYGSKFIPQVLDKIKEFKKSHPKAVTGIDGGIKLDNIRDVARMDVDIIVTGSAVFDGKAPLENTKFMISAVNDAAGK